MLSIYIKISLYYLIAIFFYIHVITEGKSKMDWIQDSRFQSRNNPFLPRKRKYRCIWSNGQTWRYNGCHDEKLLCNQLTNCHDIHFIDITKHGCVLSRLLSRDKSMVQTESKNEGSKSMLRNYRTGKPQTNGDLQSLINGRCTWRSNLVNGTINMRVNVYSFLYIPNTIPVPLISLLRQQQHHNAIPQYHLHNLFIGARKTMIGVRFKISTTNFLLVDRFTFLSCPHFQFRLKFHAIQIKNAKHRC